MNNIFLQFIKKNFKILLFLLICGIGILFIFETQKNVSTEIILWITFVAVVWNSIETSNLNKESKEQRSLQININKDRLMPIIRLSIDKGRNGDYFVKDVLMVENVGFGVAFNVRVWIYDAEKKMTYADLKSLNAHYLTLVPNEKPQHLVTIADECFEKLIKDKNIEKDTLLIECEFSDVYHRKFVQSFISYYASGDDSQRSFVLSEKGIYLKE